jgi:DNA-binding transcriptional LysR family regulator
MDAKNIIVSIIYKISFLGGVKLNIADRILLFHKVVEAGSFSQAATRVGLTNSVVSKHIAQLEEHLGVQLLFRTTRRLQLTEAGRLLYQHANDVEQSIESAVKAVTEVSSEPAGTLSLTVPTISGEHLITDIVTEFCQLYPKVNIELRLEDHMVDLVAEGVDLAIRTASLADSTLIARLLLQSKWVVSASPDYLEKYGAPKKPQDLINHNCLTYTYMETGSNVWLFKERGREYGLKVSGCITSNNQKALRNAAVTGYGVIYTPKLLVYEDLQCGRLVEVLGEYSSKELPVYIVYPYSKYLPEKTRVFIDFIAKCYESKKPFFK